MFFNKDLLHESRIELPFCLINFSHQHQNCVSKPLSSNICLEIEGKLIRCQKEVADNVHAFYANVALNLVNKMQKSTKHFSDYLPNASTNSLFLTPITQAEVEDQISALSESKAPISYGIPVKIVKMRKTLISAQLSNVFNQSFQFGIFPGELKFACVTQIHNGNSRLNMTNYRINHTNFQNLMYKGLLNFLEKIKSYFNISLDFKKAIYATRYTPYLYQSNKTHGKRFVFICIPRFCKGL